MRSSGTPGARAGTFVGLEDGDAAAAIIGMMLTATILVHWPNGFFNQEGGFEYPVILAVAAAAIALTGPGGYALDTVLGWEFEGPARAGIAVVIGALAALAVVGAQRMGGRTEGEPRTA